MKLESASPTSAQAAPDKAWHTRARPLAGSSATTLWVGMVVFLTTLALFSLTWGYSLSEGFHNLRDGVSSVGAARVLAGDMPHRDFWTMYAPGHFYLLAWLFGVFGQSLWVEIIAASLLTAFSAALVYHLAARLSASHFAAVLPAALFVVAHLNTGYYQRLGSYPTAMLFIFVALLAILRYFETNRTAHLIGAGLATGVAAWFKHDIAAYTAVAIAAGVLANAWSQGQQPRPRLTHLARALFIYGGVSLLALLPVLVYFGLAAGEQMLQNLVVFPLTDFPFARPESYPGLIPRGIWTGERLTSLEKILKYLYFNIALFLAAAGFLGAVLAAYQGRRRSLAPATTLAGAFGLHYLAAHVQINTHIITMTTYAALLGLVLIELFPGERQARGLRVRRFSLVICSAAWILMLAARPIYKAWEARQVQTQTLGFAPVNGLHVSPEEQATFTRLKSVVDETLPPGDPLFVATHRNDVVVIGDVMIYFLLARPSLTRYHELHPAITDTAAVQKEMVANLQEQRSPLVITKQIFPDETLEAVKRDFQRNLPHIGATVLDDYIHSHYAQAGQYGPYTVWRRAP